MNVKSIQERLQLLEDIEAIKALKAQYCYNADAKNWRTVANLFTEDGVWDGQTFGKHKGRKAVYSFFSKTVPSRLSFFVHMVHNPLIHVKGNEAKGVWYWTEPCTLKKTNKAAWICGRYNEDYVKQGKHWKFKRMQLKFFYFTPYEKGWVEQKIA